MKAIHIYSNSVVNYFNLIKPRETILLAFIGISTALIASASSITDYRFLILIAALLSGSAGCNGITNYLDRRIDNMMDRTRNRVLPRKMIYPPEKALFLVIPLILIGLALAWWLNPICFGIGVIGVLASTLWRKTITCTFFGIVAGCAPVLIGWFAFNSSLNLTLLLICMLVAFWIPVHVWSVMIAKKDEYLRAGLSYFPLSMSTGNTIIIIFMMNIVLYAVAVCLFVFSNFSWLYFAFANILSLAMLATSINLLHNQNSKISWRLYKLSSFPYLGIMFLIMAIDSFIL